MDYINTVTNKRVQKVIELKKRFFVYAELPVQPKYIDLIQYANSKKN
jgi:hypothetical protein